MRNRNRNTNFAVAVTAATALLLHGTAAYASPTELLPSATTSAVAVDSRQPTFSAAAGEELYQALAIIENIPDVVLAQGDAAARDYLREAFGVEAGQASTFGVVGCIAAIGAAALAIAGPVSKIRAAIKAAGGARKLYNVMSEAYKRARAAGLSRSDAIVGAKNAAIAQVHRPDYKEIILSLTGFGAVIGECLE